MKGRRTILIPEELAWLEENRHWPRDVLHSGFCFRFGRRDVSIDALRHICIRKGWKTGRTGGFQKGQPPMNKGKKMPFNPNSAATRFRKGQRPANAQQVGHESIDVNGYVKICVAAPNPWTGAPTHMAFKHRWLWEQIHGPVPEGHALKCLDGDKTNCDLANWVCIPRAMMPRLAGRWSRPYDDAPAELKPTLMAIARLEHGAREAKRKDMTR
jgi:hypothetical protein